MRCRPLVAAGRWSLLLPQPVTVAAGGHSALEVDRTAPPPGNLQIGGQQVWLGPALAGRQVTLWVDETILHVLSDGTRIKTLPSRLGVTELARLAASGARPAGLARSTLTTAAAPALNGQQSDGPAGKCGDIAPASQAQPTGTTGSKAWGKA